MTLPGNRVPAEGEPAPVWDRTGVCWSWDTRRQLYICDDPTYSGEPVTEPGAIPPERQPTFAHPPNEAQILGMQRYPDEH